MIPDKYVKIINKQAAKLFLESPIHNKYSFISEKRYLFALKYKVMKDLEIPYTMQDFKQTFKVKYDYFKIYEQRWGGEKT